MRKRITAAAAVPLIIGAAVFVTSSFVMAMNQRVGPPANPEAGLSDAQRYAMHSALRAKGEAKARAWRQAFIASHRDPRGLRQVHMLAMFEPGPSTLQGAVADADLIVIARVESVRFDDQSGAFVMLGVERTLKGSAGHQIEVTEIGGPEIAQDGVSGVLKVAENAPLLLPGDRAMLFLKQGSIFGTAGYRVQSFTGTYMLNNGRVRALAGNQFRSLAEAQSEDALASIVAGLV
jgi:hypothetical protein